MAAITYEEALKKYPDWAWAFNIPEIGEELRKGVDDPNYDAVTKILQSNWYRTTQASSRQWDALKQSDPESANARIREKEAAVWDMIAKSGSGPDVKTTQEIADKALRFGWSDDQLVDAVIGRVTYNPKYKAVGEIGIYQDQVKQLASQWYIPISDETAFNYGKQVAAGEQTMQAFEVGFKDQAKGRFPTMADQIDKGIKPKDMFQPYQERIAQLLEVPADRIDLMNDTKYNAVLDYAAEDGTRRPMTFNEVDTFTRGLDGFKKTRAGQQLAAEYGDAINKMFGKVAS